jgi:hypothetical protein
LGRAVAFHGGENGMWVLTGEGERFCCIHIIGKSIRATTESDGCPIAENRLTTPFLIARQFLSC